MTLNRLTPEQRNQLQRLVRAGKGAARVTIRARILLKTDAGWSAPQVAEALDVAEGTVYRTKRRFAEAGLGVLQDRPQAHRCRKLDDRGEAHLIALACPTRRKGMNTGPCACWPARWWSWGGALPIPRDGAAAPEKNALKPWQKQEWCIPQVSAEFVAHMEDVLDLYAEPYDPQRPVVCFDETSTQLLAEVREPLPAQPGRPKREDCEYRREGARNLFLACEPLAGWWQVAVTPRRTMQDFAHQMRWLVDQAYPEVPVVRVVLDNLNTHRMASLYETFPAGEARRIAKRLEFHYIPKHGSWLNMAEIEFSVRSRCCLKQRLPNEPALRQEVQALVRERNVARATINWRFNSQDARVKLHRLYPCNSKHD